MIRLFVADDHVLVREGLKRLVEDCEDVAVVGESEEGDRLLEPGVLAETDVLLLDISMPGPGFLELMRRLGEQWPGVHVLVLSMHAEDEYALRALRAGAAGYLSKDRTSEELTEAIRRVYRGGRYVTNSLAERLAGMLSPGTEELPHEKLSDREFQVFCMLALGRSVNDIAAELGLSPKTVGTYRSRILGKTSLRSNAEVIRYALKHRLVD